MLALAATGSVLAARPPVPRRIGPAPPIALVDRLEAELEADPCVGPLGRWNRTYEYAARDVNQRRDALAFKLVEANGTSTKPGREILRSYVGGGEIAVDDRPVKMAWGLYDIATGRLTMEHCGNNFRVTREPDPR